MHNSGNSLSYAGIRPFTGAPIEWNHTSMDLAGHHRFTSGPDGRVSASVERLRLGELLIATAWASLATARVEMVDIHLRSGAMVLGALAVRVDGPLGEASTRAGQWTHVFALEEVMLVQNHARGGRRRD